MTKRIVKQYRPNFKLKVVLEALKEEETINQIASKYEVPPTNINEWKKKFLENAEIVFNKEYAVKEYKDSLKERDREKEELYKEIGRLSTQLNWLKKRSAHLI